MLDGRNVRCNSTGVEMFHLLRFLVDLSYNKLYDKSTTNRQRGVSTYDGIKRAAAISLKETLYVVQVRL